MLIPSIVVPVLIGLPIDFQFRVFIAATGKVRLSSLEMRIIRA